MVIVGLQSMYKELKKMLVLNIVKFNFKLYNMVLNYC